MFKLTLRYIHTINSGRRLLHWCISFQHPISSTRARDRTENTCKTCTVCLNISSFANVAYKRHKQVSRVATLMSPDVKVLAEFSMQLPDSSIRLKQSWLPALWTKTQKHIRDKNQSVSCPFPSASLRTSYGHKMSGIDCWFFRFNVVRTWKRGLPRKFARFVLFRPAKKTFF